MKRAIRQSLVSAAVLAILLLAIVAVDPMVKERFTDLAWGAASPASLSDRATNLVDAAASALRYQSLENGPLLVFATAGVVLFLFMVRT